MKAYFDTAVLVAAAVARHEHHGQSIGVLASVREKRIQGHVSGHGLSEAYAVLTRTPFRPSVYPAEAWRMLEADILPYFQIVTITAKMYRETIQDCADKGWIGGRIYDALHIRCARESGCERIYTFNVRHFQQLAPDLTLSIGAP